MEIDLKTSLFLAPFFPSTFLGLEDWNHKYWESGSVKGQNQANQQIGNEKQQFISSSSSFLSFQFGEAPTADTNFSLFSSMSFLLYLPFSAGWVHRTVLEGVGYWLRCAVAGSESVVSPSVPIAALSSPRLEGAHLVSSSVDSAVLCCVEVRCA